jgi:hypothetical protein
MLCGDHFRDDSILQQPAERTDPGFHGALTGSARPDRGADGAGVF